MILPKKQDLDKAKNDERKRLIDDGISLATKVDKLRETSANEEQRLKDWREGSLKKVQQEIDEILIDKFSLLGEIQTLEERRQELLKPLTKEWAELVEAKSELGQEITENYVIGEQLKEEERKLDKDREKLLSLISKATQNEENTDKTKNDTITLKNLAQSEYKKARSEREYQTNLHESISLELCQQKKEYEVALSLIQIRENETKEKESELLIKEQHLASQQVSLQIAREVINKNATNKPN